MLIFVTRSTFCNVFKRVIPKFIRPEPNQVFNVNISEGLKFHARESYVMMVELL